MRMPDHATRSHHHCANCNRLFTSRTAFDRHQTEHYDRPAPPYVDCHDPLDRGLWWNRRRSSWSYGERMDPDTAERFRPAVTSDISGDVDTGPTVDQPPALSTPENPHAR